MITGACTSHNKAILSCTCCTLAAFSMNAVGGFTVPSVVLRLVLIITRPSRLWCRMWWKRAKTDHQMRPNCPIRIHNPCIIFSGNNLIVTLCINPRYVQLKHTTAALVCLLTVDFVIAIAILATLKNSDWLIVIEQCFFCSYIVNVAHVWFILQLPWSR